MFYSSTKYVRLTGRGIVEFTVEKVDGSTFSPEAAGVAKSTAKIQVCWILYLSVRLKLW